MHDLKAIRETPEAFDLALARRRLEPRSALVLELDSQRRAVQTELNDLQARRNEASKRIGQVKKEGGDAQALVDEVAGIKATMAALEARLGDLDRDLDGHLMGLPNILDDGVPEGPDESANVEVRRWGTPRAFDFTARQHFEIGESLGGMDFEAAARLSGARFVVLKGQIARLERALGQFMLDLHITEHGYQEVQTPVLVRAPALQGTGQLPKFAEDLFRVEQDFFLIPTAEVTLTNLVAGQVLAATALPLRMTAFTQCFRSEAGAAGKDTRGMIRQHQFEKVEMVSIVHPDDSAAELDRMTACAEDVLKRLDLPYRVMALCAGDVGFSARQTYDLEVWLPGQDRYREISSCSNTGDFQARRMNGRFKVEGEKGTRFVHTLNGSGVAVGRCLVAVLENYQNADGTVSVPEALRGYMGGLERLGG
ncbi:serine--tRNA ligase [Rhodospirillum rubrum]|uniref:serine--tRNA ligase n=1 Tax=Rhodospirillum rubrum TaxID=1085 RepID=UPI0019062FBB|nr:serine--tRNA ligase [Rhodospirillum rubrum]MBK1663570.1 serine--tRNA ligase [Rhodospirillum rubrum]MBK1675629.1 serine--tRNA ligase [Rhodospirillum rubrum]